MRVAPRTRKEFSPLWQPTSLVPTARRPRANAVWRQVIADRPAERSNLTAQFVWYEKRSRSLLDSKQVHQLTPWYVEPHARDHTFHHARR